MEEEYTQVRHHKLRMFGKALERRFREKIKDLAEDNYELGLSKLLQFKVNQALVSFEEASNLDPKNEKYIGKITSVLEDPVLSRYITH